MIRLRVIVVLSGLIAGGYGLALFATSDPKTAKGPMARLSRSPSETAPTPAAPLPEVGSGPPIAVTRGRIDAGRVGDERSSSANPPLEWDGMPENRWLDDDDALDGVLDRMRALGYANRPAQVAPSRAGETDVDPEVLADESALQETLAEMRIAQAGEQTGAAKRWRVHDLERARISPSYTGGALRGLRVGALPRDVGNVFSELGLREGDMITQVNAYSATDAGVSAIALLRELAEADEVDLTVVDRAGHSRVYRLE